MNKKTFTNNGTAAADANEQINNFLKEEKHGKLVYLFYDKIEYTCPTTKKFIYLRVRTFIVDKINQTINATNYR